MVTFRATVAQSYDMTSVKDGTDIEPSLAFANAQTTGLSHDGSSVIVSGGDGTAINPSLSFGRGRGVYARDGGDEEALVVTGGGGLESMDITHTKAGRVWRSHEVPYGSYSSVIWVDDLGLFVTSASGYVVTSKDGETWTSYNVGVTAYGLAWSPDLQVLVAVGFDKVWTSTDAITWTQQTVPVGFNSNGITWSPMIHAFVSPWSGGGSVQSLDGITWTVYETSSVVFSKVYATSTLLLAHSSKGIYTSQDGMTWTQRFYLGYTNLVDAAYSEELGIWFVVSNTAGGARGSYRSSDGGITWTNVNLRSECIAWCDGQFISIYRGTLYSSIDAINWYYGGSLPYDGVYFSITYSAALKKVVTTGYNTNQLYTSTASTHAHVSGDLRINGTITSSTVRAPITVTSIQITDEEWTAIDDTAVSTSGGYIVITGREFGSGIVARIGTVTASSTAVVSDTELRIQVPALAAGTYPLELVHADGTVTTIANAITTSPFPTWSIAGNEVGSILEYPFSYDIASSDSSLSLVTTNTTLPAGATLTVAPSGNLVTLSGNVVSSSVDTTYTFDATVQDAENQDLATKTWTLKHATTFYSPYLGAGILNALQDSRDSTTAYGEGSLSFVSGFPGSDAYRGGVLMEDGRVFCVPSSATSALIYDPATDTLSTVTGFPGSYAYFGGVLLPDGRVFCVPLSATSASIYDPSTDSVSTVPGFPGGYAYTGGVLMADGRVFCVPRNATSARIYDPVSNSVSTVPGFSGSAAYIGGVLMTDGRVFCVPHNATSASIYDPVSDSVSTVSGFPGNVAYYGGVLMADGRVFCVPYGATSASIYDPVSNTVSTVPGFPGNNAYIGGVLMADGRVFCVPINNTSASIYDPVSNIVSTVTGFPGSYDYIGGVLMEDGRVFCVPFNATSARIFDPESTVSRPFTVSDIVTRSPFLNKF